MIGKKFGRWTVLSEKDNKHKIKVQCDCGTIKNINYYSVTKGRSKSCGCLNSELIKARCSKDIHTEQINKRYGRLIITGFKGNEGKDKYQAFCKCDCGNETEVYLYSLKNGDTTSCGCYNLEVTKTRSTTHGQTKTTEWNIWSCMRDRCSNKNSPAYKYYGERGITVCTEWSKFENFYKDMGRRPEGLSLDRIDNNKGYSKDNCKWSTWTEQSRNRSFNVNLTYKGVTKCLSAWAEEYKLNYKCLHKRIQVGWPIEKALTTPSGGF